jgi:aldose 1-epimerase
MRNKIMVFLRNHINFGSIVCFLTDTCTAKYTKMSKTGDYKALFSHTRLVELALPSGAYCAIFPDYGAIPNKLVLRTQRKHDLVDVLEGYVDEQQLNGPRKFKNVWMLPYANRVNGGKYSFGGVDYELVPNFAPEPHAIHGFVYNKSFEVLDYQSEPLMASVTLEYRYIGGEQGYPFPFRFRVIYTLTDNALQMVTEIENTGTQVAPITFGWHPYFKINSECIDDMMLRMPACEAITIDALKIPTGACEVYDAFLPMRSISDIRLDTGYKLQNYLPDVDVRLELWSVTQHIGVVLGMRGFPYFQVYTPPHRQSIALEPMTSMTDAFNNGNGLVRLAPSQVLRNTMDVTVIQ